MNVFTHDPLRGTGVLAFVSSPSTSRYPPPARVVQRQGTLALQVDFQIEVRLWGRGTGWKGSDRRFGHCALECSVQLARTAKIHDIRVVLIDLARFPQCPILVLRMCETEAED